MVFCDWLSIYQQHPDGLAPDLNSGCVVRLTPDARPGQVVVSITDEDGVIRTRGALELTTHRAVQHEGSFDTSIQIRSVGGMVSLSGNVGRFGRPDNVFGFSVFECVQRANEILASLGLPPFTWRCAGERNGWRQGSDTVIRGDAVITQLHLTRNFAAGNRSRLARLMHYAGGVRVGQRSQQAKVYDTGVTWGEGSKFWYVKMYDKAADLAKAEHASEQLKQWVESIGMARFEVALKSRYLTQYGLNRVQLWQGHEMGNVIFGKFLEPLSKTEISVDQWEQIPGRLGELAMTWRNGVDLRKRLPRNTFYRYRKALRAYGIDISGRCDVSRLPVRFDTITLQEVGVPDWYQWNPRPPLRLAA